MYKSTVTLSDPWRNFIPEAPDLEVVAIAGQSTFIPLESLLVQGAVDLDSYYEDVANYSISPLPTHTRTDDDSEPVKIPGRYTLESKPSQRGWQLTYDALNTKTKYGSVDKDQHKGGFIFTPTTSEDNLDCINYYLSNGTQRSQLGTINVTIIRGHDLDFEFTYDEDRDLYFITTTKYKPESLGFYWFKITWIKVGPYAKYNDYTGRNEIARGEVEILRTQWQGYNYGLVYTQKAESLYLKAETDASLAGVHDPLTNRPYIPLNKVFDLQVRYEVFPNKSGYKNYPDFNVSYVTNIDLNARLGAPWQEYGKRVDP